MHFRLHFRCELSHDKRMIKNKSLKGILVVTIMVTVLVPLANLYIINPFYTKVLVSFIEQDAIRIVNHLSHSIKEDNGALSSNSAIRWGEEESARVLSDFELTRIKIFDNTGRIIYSSSQKDIGQINTMRYFKDIVAKGDPFSKMVQKEQLTMEGKRVTREIVETYVPVMNGQEMVVAFEFYFDISGRYKELSRLLYISLLIPGLLMFTYLGLLLFSLKRLDRSISKNIEDNAILENNRRDIEKTRDSLQEQQFVLLEEQKVQNKLFKQVEGAKRQWEATMDCVKDLVLLTDTGLRVVRCNKAVLGFTGLSFDQIIGKKWIDILADNKFEKHDFAGSSFEYFHAPSRKWLYLNIYTVKNEQSRLEGLVVTMHDLTAIKTMTFELEEKNKIIDDQRENLQYALDQISKLIQSVVDEKRFDIYFTNPNLEKCWEVMKCGQDDCPCYGKEPQRCWQNTGTFCKGEVQGVFAQKYGNCQKCSFYQGTTSDPVFLIGEQFNNMMHILAAKNSEVIKAYDELKNTQAQLLQQEKMASIGQLAAGVAHEINNPVGFVLSNLGSLDKYSKRLRDFIDFQTNLLADIDDPAKAIQVQEARKKLKLDFITSDIIELIEESIDGCERVKKIVQDLKGFSRVDQAERQIVDINECLDITLNIARNELKYKATIEKKFSSTSLIECYPQQLNQVFMNLLVNAVHAFEKDGIIIISTWQDDHLLFVSIADNGAGIPADNLGQIFEPFFTTKDVGKGTGLGLSIVYDIITKNHKGDIRVESTEGVGTTFTIELPLQPVQEGIEPVNE